MKLLTSRVVLFRKCLICFRYFINTKCYAVFFYFRYEPPPQVVHRGPFGLDPDIIAEIERGWVKSDQVKEQSLPPLDLSFMDAPIQIISNSSTAYPMDRLNQLLHSSPTSRPSSANVTLYNSSTGSPQHNSVPINRPVATPPK